MLACNLMCSFTWRFYGNFNLAYVIVTVSGFAIPFFLSPLSFLSFFVSFSSSSDIYMSVCVCVREREREGGDFCNEVRLQRRNFCFCSKRQEGRFLLISLTRLKDMTR